MPRGIHGECDSYNFPRGLQPRRKKMEHIKMTRNKAIIGFMGVAQMSHEISEKGHPCCLGAQCAKWHSSPALALYKISIDRDRSEEEGDDWHSHSENQITKVRRLERNNFENSEDVGRNQFDDSFCAKGSRK